MEQVAFFNYSGKIQVQSNVSGLVDSYINFLINESNISILRFQWRLLIDAEWILKVLAVITTSETFICRIFFLNLMSYRVMNPSRIFEI